MFRIQKRLLSILFILILNTIICAQVELPKIISEGMVIQRDKPIKIWGWASPSEKVIFELAGSKQTAITNTEGKWEVIFPQMDAGGPYSIEIEASNSITLNDIMIGDVWLCSGQSNMELQMKRVSWNYPGEIENSENKFIRQFYVPRDWNFKDPQDDISAGSWKSANSQNTPDFSATAYFFAKELYDKHRIPIGFINTSLGGSRLECWMSEETLNQFPKHYNEALMFRDDNLIENIEDADKSLSEAWYSLLDKKDEGFKEPNNIWHKEEMNTDDWKTMKIPGYWADYDLGMVNGSVWFRKNINIDENLLDKKATLVLGRIVDADSTFINGKYIGNVTYQYPPRRYEIPAGLLKKGDNTIAIRVVSNTGKGGFILDKEYSIQFADTSINLEGEWKYKLGAEMPELPGQTFIRWKPLGLYNSMIAPLLNLNIQGVIWYQGESNAGRPEEYRDLFASLINDWRVKWNDNNLPFLYVQLPNYMEQKTNPSESNWARLREAQLKTLAIKKTGMAVAIDIGEWNDIHPLNKKDVGFRLALAAEKIAYNHDIIFSGPIYKSMVIEDNKIILSFDHIGEGLISRGEKDLKEFAIAGADKNFIWANAEIVNNKIIVWSDEIINPIAVRYAWADNPEKANLYNSVGLPASPFRTDDW